jgi:butyryl-CoA dehydrogenase
MIKTIDYLMRLGKVEGATVMLSNATLFLEYFGIVTIGWMWLKQAIVAEIKLSENAVSENDKIFYESKLATNAYYFAYELPKSFALRKALIEKSHFLTLQDKQVFV